MIRIAEMTADWDRNAFLLAFCAVAAELYPELDWDDVEPRLQRSWERYLGDGDREWIEVRTGARAMEHPEEADPRIGDAGKVGQ